MHINVSTEYIDREMLSSFTSIILYTYDGAVVALSGFYHMHSVHSW